MNYPEVRFTRLPRINCNKETIERKRFSQFWNSTIFSGSEETDFMVLSAPTNFELRLKLRKVIRRVSEKNAKGKLLFKISNNN
jgi:hypothetical protein